MRIRNIRLMRVNIFTVMGIWNLCTVCILFEKRVCKLCVCVCVLVCSSRIIFGQLCLWPEYGTLLLVAPVHQLVPSCIVEL